MIIPVSTVDAETPIVYFSNSPATLIVLIVNGLFGELMEKLYVWPLYNVNVGFLVKPSGLNKNA